MITNYEIVIVKEFRRSIKLEVLPNKTVKVTAPRLMPKSIIESFVKQKNNWIQKRLMQPAPPTLTNGSSITYLGQRYILKFQEEKRKSIIFEGEDLIITSLTPIKTLHYWLRKQAFDVLEDRVSLFAKQMNVSPRGMRIKTMKSRWGSCSTLGNLNFNWALILAPLPVLDYVVIHELAHLKHMNHSKAFWKVVETHCPDYKVYIKWLKNNGTSISYF